MDKPVLTTCKQYYLVAGAIQVNIGCTKSANCNCESAIDSNRFSFNLIYNSFEIL